MSAISFSADGDYVFLALENASGNQLVARASRDDLSTWQAVYSPGAGSACNILPCVANPDVMYFYGYFGTSVNIIKHTISTITNTDISPGDDDACEALQINPDNEDEIIASLATLQDLIYTDDSGSNWADLDATLALDPVALWVLWSGKYAPHRYFVGGTDGVNTDYLYSPNEGASDENRSSAGLTATANICSIEALE